MILALNCGSSSVKYQVVSWKEHQVICKGVVERVGNESSFILHERPHMEIIKKEKACLNHRIAIQLIIETISSEEVGVIKDIHEIHAIGHRVVHGGDKFSKSVLIDDHVLASIREMQSLAPLHNPHNISGIDSAKTLLPHVPQVAVFDTAFHQTIPSHAYMYAIPYEWYTDHGARRYGFHGTSHLYVSKRAQKKLNKPVEKTCLITLHIGNGVSIAAVKGGVSVDTSMGFTPLEGAIMGTRSGDIDPAIVPYMAEKLHLSADTIVDILNKKSGLFGITGQYTDQRDVRKAATAGDVRCQLAIEMQCYRLKKYIGAYAAAMGGLDAVVFTAGVGENNPLIRAKTLEGLSFMGIEMDSSQNEFAVGQKEEIEITTPSSGVKVFVIPTNEEIVFIEDVIALLENRYDSHTRFTYSFET